jgi:hypothetical protein
MMCPLNARSNFGDSGENDGKEVKDLSDASTDDEVLEAYALCFLDLARTVCDRRLCVDRVVTWDDDREMV